MDTRVSEDPSGHVYTLRIAYDGTRYHGWQYQNGQVTVEGILREAFVRTFGRPLSLCAASRTDAGVHAYDQVVRIITPLSLEPQRFQEVWNRALPSDIVIRSMSLQQVPLHPRYDVVQKVYWYHIFVHRPLPFLAPYGWYYGAHFNPEVLRACLKHVEGQHDFRSFCTGTTYKSTIRTIDATEVQWLAKYAAYRIIVRGQRFMHFMIRRIVGAAVAAASQSSDGEKLFCTTLQQCDPQHHLVTAPACGLILRKIYYT
jgi:tRNA pseudouridine38-40 synthase